MIATGIGSYSYLKYSEQGFKTGSKLGQLYWGWVFLLRFIVPVAVVAVLLHAVGVI